MSFNRKEYQNRLVEEGREYILDYLLKNPCVRCGEKDIRVLEFNHIKPGKVKGGISRLLRNGATTKRLQKEIELCEVLCANCHKKYTAQQFGGWRQDYHEKKQKS